MAVNTLLTEARADTLGATMTTGDTLAVYALTLKGTLDGALVSILVDIDKSGVWINAGSLTYESPTKLIMLPSRAFCTAKVYGGGDATSVTVVIAS